MDSVQNREATLNRLEASLETMFKSIGSVFNGASPLDGDKLAKTQARVNGAIPRAVENLNDALDTLESDLIRTRAVLTRDMEMLRAANSKPSEPTNGEAFLNLEKVDEPQGNANANSSSAQPGSEAPNVNQPTQSHVSSPEVTLIEPPAKEGQESGKTNQAAGSSAENIESLRAEPKGKENTGDPSKNLNGTEARINQAPMPDADKSSQIVKPESEKTANANSASSTAQPSQQNASNLTSTIEEDTTRDDQAEPSPGNDFSSLLPGLDMYANDPSGDAIGGMDNFHDMAASNTFDMNNTTDADSNPFGNIDDSNQFGGEVNFDDLISFDANNTGGDGDGQGGLDVFDENFFSMSGT